MSMRISRIAFRKGLKRDQRRKRRQQLAKQKAQEDSDALKLLQQNPVYLTLLADQEALILCREEEERRVSEANHKAWLEREQVAQFEFQKQRAIEEEVLQREREQRDKIRREFEEADKRRKLIKEQRKKAEEEILRNHQIKLQDIRDYINGLDSDVPQSLLGTTETNPSSAQECQYFKKTSVCRFGDKCSRKHVKAKLSSILLIHNLFRTENFLKGHTLTTADEIIQNCLEVNREFNEFFDDICEELEKFGQMSNLLVCTNTEKQMIGNVYVEYGCAKSALAACYQLNGRFYGGQKLVIEFCHNLSWRTAICGLSLNNKCSRGNTCNYLHVFRNPDMKYPLNMNTIQSGTPSPAVESLNNNTAERKETSWEEPQTEMINRRHWRWSVSPERREDNQKPEKPLAKEPFKGEESTRSRSPTTIRAKDRHKEKGKKRKRSRSRSKSRSRDTRRHHRPKHKK